jgi:uncharacterized protein YfaS (alpha-2-macroglobulin family)
MPAAAAGEVELVVSTDAKKVFLDIEDIEPSAKEIEPGGKLGLKIRAKDAKGNGKKTALAVMVVDEGVLSLMDVQTPEPLTFFHGKRDGGVGLHALHPAVLARDEPPAVGAGAGTGAGFGHGGGGPADGTLQLGDEGRMGRPSGSSTASGRAGSTSSSAARPRSS